MRAVQSATGTARAAAQRALERYRYQVAARQGTVFAWRRFLGQHPRGILAKRARRQLAAARFRALGPRPSLQALARFVDQHGDDPLARKAWSRYVAGRAAQLAASGSPTAIETFLRRHPHAPLRRPLQDRLERLAAQALQRHPTAAGIRRFLARHPTSRYRHPLRELLRRRALAKAYYFGSGESLIRSLRRARPWVSRAVQRRVAHRALGLLLLDAWQRGWRIAQLGAAMARIPEGLLDGERAPGASPGRRRGERSAPLPRREGAEVSARAWLGRMGRLPGGLQALLDACAAAAWARLEVRRRALLAALRGSSLDTAVYAAWRLADEASEASLKGLLDGVAAPDPLVSLHAALALLGWGSQPPPKVLRRTVAGYDWAAARVALLEDMRDQILSRRPRGLSERLRALALTARLARIAPGLAQSSASKPPSGSTESLGRPWPRPWTATGALLEWMRQRAITERGGHPVAGPKLPARSDKWRSRLLGALRLELKRLRATLPWSPSERKGLSGAALAVPVALSLFGQGVRETRRLFAEAGVGTGAAWLALVQQSTALADEARQRLGQPERSRGPLGRDALRSARSRSRAERARQVARIVRLLAASRAPETIWRAVCSLGVPMSRCEPTFTP